MRMSRVDGKVGRRLTFVVPQRLAKHVCCVKVGVMAAHRPNPDIVCWSWPASSLSPEHFEVQRVALGELAITTATIDSPAAQGTSSQWQTLSKAEHEVAILAAADWSTSAIGLHRGTSTRTIDIQMSSILRKLMIGLPPES